MEIYLSLEMCLSWKTLKGCFACCPSCCPLLVICSSLVAYTLSLYVYIHEAFIILSCYLNCGLT